MMQSSHDLGVLNYTDGMIKVRGKLSENLQRKWRSEAHAFEDANYGRTPLFLDLVNFIKRQARELSNQKYDIVGGSLAPPKTSKTFFTSTDQGEISCPIHKGSKSHSLEDCTVFKALNFSDRRKKAIELKLCYYCLRQHFKSKCKLQLKCSKCDRAHHDIMCPKNDSGASSSSTMTRADDQPNSNSLCTPVSDSDVTCKKLSKTVLLKIFMKDNQTFNRKNAIIMIYLMRTIF